MPPLTAEPGLDYRDSMHADAEQAAAMMLMLLRDTVAAIAVQQRRKNSAGCFVADVLGAR